MPDGAIIMLGYALVAIVSAMALARRLPRDARVIWIIFAGVIGAAGGTALTFGRERFADPELLPVWSWIRSIGFSDLLNLLEGITRHPTVLATAALFLATVLIGLRTPLEPMLREAMRRTFTALGVCAALLVATVVLVIGNSPVDWAEGTWILLMLLPIIATASGAIVFSPIRGRYWRLVSAAPAPRTARPVGLAPRQPEKATRSARNFIRDSLRDRGGIDLAVLDEAFTKSWQREAKVAEYGATPSGSGAALLGGPGRAGSVSRRRTTDPVARAVGRDGVVFRRKVERMRRQALIAAVALLGMVLVASWLLFA